MKVQTCQGGKLHKKPILTSFTTESLIPPQLHCQEWKSFPGIRTARGTPANIALFAEGFHYTKPESPRGVSPQLVVSHNNNPSVSLPSKTSLPHFTSTTAACLPVSVSLTVSVWLQVSHSLSSLSLWRLKGFHSLSYLSLSLSLKIERSSLSFLPVCLSLVSCLSLC